MKNVIYKYEAFKNNILPNTSPIYVNSMYFVGIKFSDTSAFIYFEGIDDSSRAFTFTINMKPEDDDEFELYKKGYTYLSDIKGFCMDMCIPTLLCVSCFHKSKDGDNTEFIAYAKYVSFVKDEKEDVTVYKLVIPQGTFIGIMSVLNKFRELDFIDSNPMNNFNKFNSNTKYVSINNNYTPILRKIFISKDIMKKETFFNRKKNYNAMALVTFKSVSEHFRLFIPYTTGRDSYNKIDKSYFVYDYTDLENFELELEQEDTYIINELDNIEYSLSADNPMNKLTLFGLHYRSSNDTRVYDKASDSIGAIIVEMSEKVYCDIVDLIT